MPTCRFCNNTDSFISTTLEVCRNCIINGDWEKIEPHILKIHSDIRKLEGLPAYPPKSNNNQIKLTCNLCMNECRMSESDISYCGLRDPSKNKQGVIPFPTKSRGYIHGYIERNPTNCCNSWFCPAGTSAGYPNYSVVDGPEFNTYSYAAFLYGCTFNCLFCQNTSHKHFSKRNLYDTETLANQIINNNNITCICFFGGAPEAQLPFSLNLANKILEKKEKERIMRICWEWNGSGNKDWIEKCMEIAVKTGGNIKFDLKTFHEKLNIALCGISNKRTLENFKFFAEKYFGKRKGMPEMSACTLLVSGYTNYEEVEKIAKFIGSINENIPYSLLVFHGDYQMKDLTITPRNDALKCLEVAKTYVKQVNLGNKFLLGFS